MTVASYPTGKIVQVLGAVVDIEFPQDQLPKIYDELRLKQPAIDLEQALAFEVEQHMGNNWVRCIALGATDGLQRGAEVINRGRPISVPVGPQTLGRVFNVLGQPVDNAAPITDAPLWQIHREAPILEDQTIQAEMLETGIKVIDLISAFCKRWKDRCLWRGRGWKNCDHSRVDQQYCAQTQW
ncbi:hypothetical protein KDK_75520 [Dictyobacter kobayashii]|uniref:ATPase F1/V1/A1 complex alpha/beta subunit N-terminal domain-containing protein n=1 Tax=Dictyobacter kobayashii TaxID=2014872 RepID=A0A402AXA1_9CHLR|nr:hypothetical protein [Dictyobacter kobayashii]GCE23752.1 hypothetical protein KDK_75520 [Dictyobacter kobayashii]